MRSDMIRWPIALGVAFLVGLVLALGMAGWIRHAADLMLSLGQAGLSWCL